MSDENTPAEIEQPDTAIEFNGEVEALLVERAGYESRGLKDRVAEVDDQLALRGHAAEARAKAAPKGVKGRAASGADQTA